MSGVKLLGVEVSQLKYDEKIQSALQEKRVEEAKKDADLIRQESQLKQCQVEAEKKEIIAKSNAQSVIIEAKATADANKILQKSELEGLAELVKVVGASSAIQLMSAIKAADEMKALSQNKGSVIALPLDMKGLVNVLVLSNLPAQI